MKLDRIREMSASAEKSKGKTGERKKRGAKGGSKRGLYQKEAGPGRKKRVRRGQASLGYRPGQFSTQGKKVSTSGEFFKTNRDKHKKSKVKLCTLGIAMSKIRCFWVGSDF